MPRTLADDLAADVARTFLQTDHFAETVVRYPLGDEGAGANVTAVVEEPEPIPDEEGGESIRRRMTLHVAESVSADPRDAWLVRDELWQAVGVRAPEYGMRRVVVERTDRISTHSTEGMDLL